MYHLEARLRQGSSSKAIVRFLRRVLPIKRYQEWSIGTLAGDTPWSLSPDPANENPVLTHRDITDASALYVSDPFVVRAHGEYVMFLEVMNRRDMKGNIGLARSRDRVKWQYDCIVLDERFHLSYPHVFVWEGDYYMLPESHEACAVLLYASDGRMTNWALRSVLLEGAYVDPSIFHEASRWWLFVCELGNEVLRLFHSAQLGGPYAEHPASPVVVGDAHGARPAGRIIAWNGRLFRAAQDDDPQYGLAVDLYEITALTPNHYEETLIERVLRGSGSGWNACGMHHLDAMQVEEGRWFAVTDGWRSAWRFGFRRES